MTNANTRAVAALMGIVNNQKARLQARLEAAETILTYETATEIVDRTKAFLTAIFEDAARVSVEDRLTALKLARRAEAKRVVQSTSKATNSDADKELWKTIEIAARRMKLYRAGLWEQVTPDWADDLLRDDYIPPPPDTDISDLFDD